MTDQPLVQFSTKDDEKMRKMFLCYREIMIGNAGLLHGIKSTKHEIMPRFIPNTCVTNHRKWGWKMVIFSRQIIVLLLSATFSDISNSLHNSISWMLLWRLRMTELNFNNYNHWISDENNTVNKVYQSCEIRGFQIVFSGNFFSLNNVQVFLDASDFHTVFMPMFRLFGIFSAK